METKKSLKRALALLMSVLMLFSAVGFQASAEEPACQHTNTEWVVDGDNHNEVCKSCGDTVSSHELIPDAYWQVNAEGTKHYKVCTNNCGRTIAEHAVDLEYTPIVNSTKHRITCNAAGCDFTEDENCTQILVADQANNNHYWKCEKCGQQLSDHEDHKFISQGKGTHKCEGCGLEQEHDIITYYIDTKGTADEADDEVVLDISTGAAYDRILTTCRYCRDENGDYVVLDEINWGPWQYFYDEDGSLTETHKRYRKDEGFTDKSEEGAHRWSEPTNKYIDEGGNEVTIPNGSQVRICKDCGAMKCAIHNGKDENGNYAWQYIEDGDVDESTGKAYDIHYIECQNPWCNYSEYHRLGKWNAVRKEDGTYEDYHVRKCSECDCEDGLEEQHNWGDTQYVYIIVDQNGDMRTYSAKSAAECQAADPTDWCGYQECEDCGAMKCVEGDHAIYDTYNSSEHYSYCIVCGFVESKGAHTMAYSKGPKYDAKGNLIGFVNEEEHVLKCTECNYFTLKHEPDWKYVDNGDGTHTKTCKFCEHYHNINPTSCVVQEAPVAHNFIWKSKGDRNLFHGSHFEGVCADCGAKSGEVKTFREMTGDKELRKSVAQSDYSYFGVIFMHLAGTGEFLGGAFLEPIRFLIDALTDIPMKWSDILNEFSKGFGWLKEFRIP